MKTKQKPARRNVREPRERTISSVAEQPTADAIGTLGASEQPETILPEAQNNACLQESLVVDSSASSTITNGPTAKGHKIMVTLRKRKTDKSGSTSYSIDGLKSSVYFNKGMFAGEAPDTIEINADPSIFAQPGSTVKAAAPRMTAEERKAEAARKKAEFDALSPAEKAALKLEAARAALAKLEAAVAAAQ